MRWLLAGLGAGFVLGFLVAWTLVDGADASHDDDGRPPAAPAVVAPPGRAQGPADDPAAARPAPRAGRAAVPAPSEGSAPPGPASATGASGSESRARSDAASGKPDGEHGRSASAPAGAPPAGPAASPGAASASDRTDTPSAVVSSTERAATGVVVDATTRLPISGARVLFATAGGGRDGSWQGDTTDAEGRFRHEAERDAPPGTRFQLRVSKDGYERREVAPEPGEMRIELRPAVVSELPGRVLGTVRGAGGKPVSGEIEIEGADEHTGNAAQIAVADANGRFALEGVPAGRWRLRWRGPWVAVTVAGGADVAAEFPFDGKGDAHFVTDVDPSAVRPEDPVLADRLAALVAHGERVEKDPALDDATRERLTRGVAAEIQRLDEDARAARPRRDVALTGVPATGRSWMRLEVKPRLFRRVEVRDGAARFPQVPVGAYEAVLVEPGRPDARAAVVVPPGEGEAAIEWAPR